MLAVEREECATQGREQSFDLAQVLSLILHDHQVLELMRRRTT